MDRNAIKLELIEWLSRLDDEETIQYLKIVKDLQTAGHDWWNDLTENQKKRIEKGLKDIDEGRVRSHEYVKKKYGFA
ncbi:MAG: hypothetical protein R6U46_01415 [Marinilabilia sp.]